MQDYKLLKKVWWRVLQLLLLVLLLLVRYGVVLIAWRCPKWLLDLGSAFFQARRPLQKNISCCVFCLLLLLSFYKLNHTFTRLFTSLCVLGSSGSSENNKELRALLSSALAAVGAATAVAAALIQRGCGLSVGCSAWSIR